MLTPDHPYAEAKASSSVKIKGTDVVATWKVLTTIFMVPIFLTFYTVCVSLPNVGSSDANMNAANALLTVDGILHFLSRLPKFVPAKFYIRLDRVADSTVLYLGNHSVL